jgi:hypothetical protein
MSGEFDDVQVETVALDKLRHGVRSGGGRLSRIPVLIAEAYGAAAAPVRITLLECLLRPVGPLALVAIASGAFGALLHRGKYKRIEVSVDDAARITTDQMLDLACFVEQCNPDAFSQVASFLTENPVGIAGLGGSVLLLALQAWRKRESIRES